MGVSDDVPVDTDARLIVQLKAWLKDHLSGSDMMELDQALASLSRRGSLEHSDVRSGRGSPKGGLLLKGSIRVLVLFIYLKKIYLAFALGWFVCPHKAILSSALVAVEPGEHIDGAARNSSDAAAYGVAGVPAAGGAGGAGGAGADAAPLDVDLNLVAAKLQALLLSAITTSVEPESAVPLASHRLVLRCVAFPVAAFTDTAVVARPSCVARLENETSYYESIHGNDPLAEGHFDLSVVADELGSADGAMVWLC